VYWLAEKLAEAATLMEISFLFISLIFRIGGVLKMLGAYHLIDHTALREFLFTCQTDVMTSEPLSATCQTGLYDFY
jgi:hypothetical protein